MKVIFKFEINFSILFLFLVFFVLRWYMDISNCFTISMLFIKLTTCFLLNYFGGRLTLFGILEFLLVLLIIFLVSFGILAPFRFVTIVACFKLVDYFMSSIPLKDTRVLYRNAILLESLKHM